MTVFETLNGLNVNEHTEKKKVDSKTELTYLSWPWAWAEVKKRYPDAHYEIKRNKNGLPYVCDPATGFMVFTSVTIEGITHDMWLPVMDGANNAMKTSDYTFFVKNPNFKYARQGDDGKYYDKYGNEQPQFFEKKVKAATMFDVNKTIMRCLVKNLAMFGLGLYIYAGEDLPEGEEPVQQAQTPTIPQDAQKPGEKVDVPKPGAWNPMVAASKWAKENGVQLVNLNKMREALISAAIIPNVDVMALTPEQFDQLIRAIEANYADMLRKPA